MLYSDPRAVHCWSGLGRSSTCDVGCIDRNYRIVCLAVHCPVSRHRKCVRWHAFGNCVELKNIPKLLHKLSHGQFKLVWSESFCAREHLALERLVFGFSTMSWPEMIDLLDANKDRHRSEFLHWHMQITSTVWGQWKYSLSAGTTCMIVGLIQRPDLNGQSAVSCLLMSSDPERQRWCGAVGGETIGIRRKNQSV